MLPATTMYVQLRYIRVDNSTTILLNVLTCSLFERYNNTIRYNYITYRSIWWYIIAT